jgi:uncharacterized BrkB/YihY/UPF0761 family membrane protein
MLSLLGTPNSDDLKEELSWLLIRPSPFKAALTPLFWTFSPFLYFIFTSLLSSSRSTVESLKSKWSLWLSSLLSSPGFLRCLLAPLPSGFFLRLLYWLMIKKNSSSSLPWERRESSLISFYSFLSLNPLII